MINTIFYFEPSKLSYIDNWNAGEISPRTIVFVGGTGEIYKNNVRYGGLTTSELISLINLEIESHPFDPSSILDSITLLRQLIDGLNTSLDTLISDKEQDIQNIIYDILSEYTWLKKNLGDVFKFLGFVDELNAWLTTTGVITDDSASWSSIWAKVDEIDVNVASLKNNLISEATIKAWIDSGVAGIDLSTYALKADLDGLLDSTDFETLLNAMFDLKLEGNNAFLSLRSSLEGALATLGAWSNKFGNDTVTLIIGALQILVNDLEDSVTTSLSATVRQYLNDELSDGVAAYLLNQSGLVFQTDLDNAIASIFTDSRLTTAIQLKINTAGLVFQSNLDTAIAGIFADSRLTDAINTRISNAGLLLSSNLDDAVAQLFSTTSSTKAAAEGLLTNINTAGFITLSDLDSAMATIIAMNGASLGAEDAKTFYCKEEDTSATPATFTVASGLSIEVGSYYSANELATICSPTTASTILGTTTPFLIEGSSKKYKIVQVSATEGAIGSSKLYAAIQVGIKGDSSFINAVANQVSITASNTCVIDPSDDAIILEASGNGVGIGRGPVANGVTTHPTIVHDTGGITTQAFNSPQWDAYFGDNLSIRDSYHTTAVVIDPNGASWRTNVSYSPSSYDEWFNISLSSGDAVLSSDYDLKLSPDGKVILAPNSVSGTEIDSPLTVGGATTFSSTVSINDNVFIGSSSSANSTTLNVYDTVTTINSIAEVYKIKSSSNTIGQISAGVVSGTGNVEIAGVGTDVSNVNIRLEAAGTGKASISGMTSGVASATNTKISCGTGGSEENITLTTSGITSTSTITSSSDERKKNIIQQKNISIDAIANTRIVDFEYKGRESHRQYTGAIAQDWLDIVPNAVIQEADGYYSLDYSGIAIASAVTAAREIVALKNENAVLRERLEAVEARLQLLENA